MSAKEYSDIRELLISVRKQILDVEPSGTGKFLNEFFDYRSRIKQNRINSFIESLQTYLQQTHYNEKIHFDLLNEEDFTDIFESVLRRVVVTKSLEKLNRFKLIITKSLIEPKEINFTESFLDLITGLHEKQIEILYCYYEIDRSLKRDGLLELNNTLRIELSSQNELREKGEKK